MLSRPAGSDTGSAQSGRPSTVRRDLVVVFAAAAGLRLVAGVLLSGTYDYDEFILLTLSRQYAHGFHPYRDMLYFHPPGALLVGRALDPVTSLWWPAARVFSGLVDSLTAVLTYVAARSFLQRRAALAAGFAYAASPLTLIAGVRVGPDPLIALLGVAGLCVLLHSTSRRAALVAGGLLGLAIGTKYTAVLLLPAYFLAAPRRFWAIALGTGGAFALLLAPYLSDQHALTQQTIVYQGGRGFMPLDERLGAAAIYWLAAAPLAVFGLLRRAPMWVKVGFLAGATLVVAPQVYYHYFVLLAPFAALLSAPLLAELRWPTYRTVSVVAAAGLIWLSVIAVGGERPLLVTAGRFSDVAPTVELLRHETAPGDLIMSDRYEYAFLAGRRPLIPYFWNVRPLIKGATLQQQLPCAAAVVLAGGPSSGYPQGTTDYLDRHYQARRSGSATVWIVHGRAAPGGSRSPTSCERFVFVPREPCPKARCVPGPHTDEVVIATALRKPQLSAAVARPARARGSLP